MSPILLIYKNETELLRMTSWPDEKQARVHPEVNLTLPLRLLFLSHVKLVLVIDEIDNWSPRVPVVDIVAKARGVNHGQLDLESLFFKLGLDDLDLVKDENYI